MNWLAGSKPTLCKGGLRVTKSQRLDIWKDRLQVALAVIAILGIGFTVIGWLSDWQASLNIAKASTVSQLRTEVDTLKHEMKSSDSLLASHIHEDDLLFKHQLDQLSKTQRLLAVGIFVHDNSNIKQRAEVFTRFMDGTLDADSLLYELFKHPHVRKG
jgi:hypothetical protein